jgi:hypothetical protein
MTRPRPCVIHCRCCGARWAATDPVASWLRHCRFQRAETTTTLPMWISK